jgi:hypothetical protein
MRERPPDRAHVANDRVGDLGSGRGDRREAGRDDVGGHECVVAHERPDPKRAAALLDPIEPGDPVHVDQVSGGRQPELEQGNEALAAGKDLGVLAQPV